MYATIVVLCVLSLFGVAALPNSLDVLSDSAVLGIFGFIYLVEFFADKIPGVDSIWDATHTFICGPAGTLLVAGAVIDAGELLILAAALLGGGAVALGGHATKADSRVIVNISPELVSNWIVLLLEDIIVIVGISLAAAKPVFFFAMLGVFCLVAVWLLPKIWRGLKSIFARFFPAKADGSPKVEGPENRGFDLYHIKE
ncbi:MAG: DUF4126 domain-containing protein [Pseudomonadota bacterium]|nr:DUF4126 domain-containing protein [Pseudomonadota bacterium]